ncbi:GNAT family N-acetyltransferase [Brachybacterium endophyticum]|uniref:GNAT family N-acetyltransferase n=1 Tax=Brachybacterium endophyticum TaxID=2182385 RepID=UPI001403F0BB|nr:GNAT family N-acetyltransferase [Brachybacterium endophyticum]
MSAEREHHHTRPAGGPPHLAETITLHPLTPDDAAAIVAAEDESTIRFLSGGRSTVDGTRAYIERLDREAAAGKRKRTFGIWVEGSLVGTIDYDPDVTDGLDPGDVNIAYGVASRMRGRGIAVRAVELVCAIIRERGVGDRAAIRTADDNPASQKVASRAGFQHLRTFESATDVDGLGAPLMMQAYVRDLRRDLGGRHGRVSQTER